MTTATTISKKQFATNAAKHGVTAGYSGSTGTMLISGDDAKVKSFIRLANLKGKKSYHFEFAQAK